MTLRERIDADIRKAMLERDERAKDALRVAKADLMLQEVALGRPVTDDEVVASLRRALKARRDALEQFRGAGRTDLVEKELAEIAILDRYLPKALDEAETRAAITGLIGELGLSGKKDLGRLMKELKTRHPSVDGRLASTLAAALLG